MSLETVVVVGGICAAFALFSVTLAMVTRRPRKP